MDQYYILNITNSILTFKSPITRNCDWFNLFNLPGAEWFNMQGYSLANLKSELKVCAAVHT